MVNEENILMKALYDMDFERIKSILKQGFDVNEPYNKHGWTPFMFKPVGMLNLAIATVKHLL